MSFATIHQTRHGLRNWTAVMADSRKSRLRTRTTFLKADGSYDLSAIMREAVRHARRCSSLRCWQRQMAVGLRVVWGRAKAERLERAH
jgi:hypothetical protein